jgi:hypothetical protein
MSRISESIARFRKAIVHRPSQASIVELPMMSDDDALFLAGLARATRDWSDQDRRAPMRVGPYQGGANAFVELHVLKPCKKGLPRSVVVFRATCLRDALHDAKRFVEALLPCEDE